MSSERIPLFERVTTWLGKRGWTKVDHGIQGELWRQGEDARSEIGVLYELEKISNPLLPVSGVASAFSDFSTTEIEKAIETLDLDITNFRAANDIRIKDSIALTSAITMLSSARTMIRSSATASRNIKSSIDGNYSKLGDELANQVRIGHSQNGSYIIPVLNPVGRPENVQVTGQLFEGQYAPVVESAERRITRTFVEAMRAVNEVVVKPGNIPSGDGIMELIRAGATKEFISAIAKTVTAEDVNSFSVHLDWAEMQEPPETLKEAEFEVPSGASTLLEATAEKLSKKTQDKIAMLAGPIVSVRNEPDNPEITVAIQTWRKGRKTDVFTTVTNFNLSEVMGWMESRITVHLEGIVERSSGRLLISSPTAFGPAEFDLQRR